MELSSEFIQTLQSLVLSPDLSSGLVILVLSFVNELIAVLPYAVVLSGQLLFLEGALTLPLLYKLFIFVAIPVGVGSTLGSLPVYGLAYFGGKPLINKYHKYLHFSWYDVEKVNARFKGEWYDEIVFLLVRTIPLLPSLPVNVAAGILRMRFFPYVALTLAGFIIRMIITLIIVGYGLHGLSQLLILIYTL